MREVPVDPFDDNKDGRRPPVKIRTQPAASRDLLIFTVPRPRLAPTENLILSIDGLWFLTFVLSTCTLKIVLASRVQRLSTMHEALSTKPQG